MNYTSEHVIETQETKTKGGGVRGGDAATEVKITREIQPGHVVKRDENGCLMFPDYPNFRPNLSPKDVLQMGSFGGGYFRPIQSSVAGNLSKGWEDLPTDWLSGLSIASRIASPSYDPEVNRYKVKCGASLEEWEQSEWIRASDPFGWFQWYCRFYQGRRTSDDERQVSRALGVMGPKGRWRNNLINKILSSPRRVEEAVDDPLISPVIRQTLQHWGYKTSLADVKAFMKKK